MLLVTDHMVETYSSLGLVMALYVARIVAFCFPHVVDVSALSICIVLCAFVSSCKCCMFVSCVHPVAVLNAAFCMTCSLLML